MNDAELGGFPGGDSAWHVRSAGRASGIVFLAVLRTAIPRALAAPETSAATVAETIAATQPSSSDAPPASPDGFRVIPRVAAMFGNAEGFVQTPAGGEPGTTSAGRPTLEELGIDDVQIMDLSVTFAWDDHEIFAGGQWVELEGSAVLEQTLISQGETFPAGSPVSAEIEPSWYSFSYRHRFRHDLGAAKDALTLTPSLGVAILDMDYEISGVGGARAHRAYVKPSPEIGIAVDWRATDRLTVTGSIRSALAMTSSPAILAAQLEAQYRLLDARNLSAEAVLGVAYEHIEYDDARKQEVPNHVDVEMGPLFIVGLRVTF